MDSVALVEREVQDRQGRWYSLRIRPYKSLDNKIDGAVLSLFDVDILKRSEQRAELAQGFAAAVMESTTQPLAVAVLDAALQVRHVNAAFASLLLLSPEAVKGHALVELGGAAWRLDEWQPQVGLPIGATLPDIAKDPAGRWPRPLRVAGRLVPSPEFESSMVLVSVTEEPAASRDARS